MIFKHYFKVIKTLFQKFLNTNSRKKKDFSKHELAEICKNLCIISYKIILNKNITPKLSIPIYKDFYILNKHIDQKTNFKVVTYKNKELIINCFIGTDPKNIKDHLTNIKMGIGKITKQMEYARIYTKYILKQFCNRNMRIINSGHSEGGSEAIYSAIYNKLECFSFNAFSLSNRLLKDIEEKTNNHEFSKNIYNYRNAHDPISKLINNDIGETYIVKSKNFKPLFSLKHAHALTTMKDCRSAIPLAEFLKTHPLFINKIKFYKK